MEGILCLYISYTLDRKTIPELLLVKCMREETLKNNYTKTNFSKIKLYLGGLFFIHIKSHWNQWLPLVFLYVKFR